MTPHSSYIISRLDVVWSSSWVWKPPKKEYSWAWGPLTLELSLAFSLKFGNDFILENDDKGLIRSDEGSDISALFPSLLPKEAVFSSLLA